MTNFVTPFQKPCVRACEVLESGLKILMTSMSLNAQNEILQIMALKGLRGIASDIAESAYYQYHG